jgi:transcriptional regulator
LKDTSGDVFQIEEGALYPALHRMERKGWVNSEWGLSDNNRRAKFYRLTKAGRRALNSERATWAKYSEAVARVFEAPAPTIS